MKDENVQLQCLLGVILLTAFIASIFTSAMASGCASKPKMAPRTIVGVLSTVDPDTGQKTDTLVTNVYLFPTR